MKFGSISPSEGGIRIILLQGDRSPHYFKNYYRTEI